MEPNELKKIIIDVLIDKKALDVAEINVIEMTTMTDYFIIASGRSATQTKALYGYVDEKLSKMGIEPKHVDGVSSAKWIAVDYGDIILHIFQKEMRDFYHLDTLWTNGENVTKY